jgi:Holliday junction DNA helicase RuvB
LVGATTRAGDLTAPLRDRFGIVSKLEYYTEAQLMDIVSRSSKVFNVVAEKDAVREIAVRSRGTPRIANRLLRRVRDFAQVYNDGHLDLAVTKHALDALKVDGLGLDEVDLRYLRGIIERFKGGPVGLNTIATAVGEEPGTIEEVYEPFLIQEGYIMRTPRGREATEFAYKHLGRTKGAVNGELELF